MYRNRASFSNWDERDQPAARAPSRVPRCIAISTAVLQYLLLPHEAIHSNFPRAVRLWNLMHSPCSPTEFGAKTDRELYTMYLDRTVGITFELIYVNLFSLKIPHLWACDPCIRQQYDINWKCPLALFFLLFYFCPLVFLFPFSIFQIFLFIFNFFYFISLYFYF